MLSIIIHTVLSVLYYYTILYLYCIVTQIASKLVINADSHQPLQKLLIADSKTETIIKFRRYSHSSVNIKKERTKVRKDKLINSKVSELK